MVVMVMQSRGEEKKRLPLAKASTGTLSLADAIAVGKLFETATTVPAADYFQQQFKRQVEEMGLTKDFEKVLAEIDTFVNIIHDSASNYCFGDEAQSAFMTYQNKLSDAAAKALGQSKTQKIDFDFAINDTSALIQGSSSDGAALDDSTTKQLNNIYSNWLATNQMICKNGVIYEGALDEKGRFKGDTKMGDDGQPKRVDPNKYADLFMGKVAGQKGFAAFVKEKTTIKDVPNSGIDLNVTDRSAELSSTQKPQG